MRLKQTLTTAARDLLVNGLLSSPLVPESQRWRALRAAGINASPSTIAGRAFFGGTDISIGRGSFINYDAFLDGSAAITIGARVQFGPGVMVITGSHHIAGPQERAGANYALPVVIGDGCWIGARAVILPGVTIGPGCVIAAGAVVSADCERNSVYAGVPARRKRGLEDDDADAAEALT
ncbi:hypothetical protein AL755_06140 [Arthrobacter sp. ERGS1:01]|uniref:DapH/DapD/GlmU-related protein n=1 Tax=Arthrobacter sp. ERGS1:01 TaxID=1704044 RepID=UPI0006B674D9|nr:DapH/DapD/GlmU-related protein [Arthrobacter sp. ERGS1:01]ALE05156.1 hypothetical protein AL755_06140 [Arthrobacter sp. ERGS1:01]